MGKYLAISYRVNEKSNPSFYANVVNKFRNDTIGNICLNDSVLLGIGERLWSKASKSKEKENTAKKSVAADMRLLALLFQTFKELKPIEDFREMFNRVNFKTFEMAIAEISTKVNEDGTISIKPGLKHNLYYLIKTTVTIIKGMYLILGAKCMNNFLELLNLRKSDNFGDAQYQLHQN